MAWPWPCRSPSKLRKAETLILTPTEMYLSYRSQLREQEEVLPLPIVTGHSKFSLGSLKSPGSKRWYFCKRKWQISLLKPEQPLLSVETSRVHGGWLGRELLCRHWPEWKAKAHAVWDCSSRTVPKTNTTYRPCQLLLVISLINRQLVWGGFQGSLPTPTWVTKGKPGRGEMQKEPSKFWISREATQNKGKQNNNYYSLHSHGIDYVPGTLYSHLKLAVLWGWDYYYPHLTDDRRTEVWGVTYPKLQRSKCQSQDLNLAVWLEFPVLITPPCCFITAFLQLERSQHSQQRLRWLWRKQSGPKVPSGTRI